MNQRVYLDYNATTPLLPEARRAMEPLLGGVFGNASSVHREGQAARAALEQARRQLAALIGAEADTLVLTSGATEAINFAIQGRAYHARALGLGDHVVTTAIEHPAVLSACRQLEKDGFRLTLVEVGPSGVVEAEAVVDALTPETILVSVMAVNNELGTIQPVAAIARGCRDRGIVTHIDAAQACGKITVAADAWDADLLSLSAHKFYGPKGVGALFIRPGTEMRPLLFGGRHERGRRAGTENVLAAVGAGAAAAGIGERVQAESFRLAALRDRFERHVLELALGAWVNGDRTQRVANTANLGFPGLEGETLMIALDLEGVAASFGSACSSGSLSPSHVLKAIGLPPERAQASLRFSLGLGTTGEQIDRALAALERALARLQSSPQPRALRV